MSQRNILLVILITAIALIGVYFFNNPKTASTKNTAPMAASTPIPTTSPDETQIKSILEEQVPNKSGVKKFEVVELNIKEGFAKATIKPLDVETDNAFVILQKKENNWEIIYGPGTDLSPENPIYKTLPEGLLGF